MRPIYLLKNTKDDSIRYYSNLKLLVQILNSELESDKVAYSTVARNVNNVVRVLWYEISIGMINEKKDYNFSDGVK